MIYATVIIVINLSNPTDVISCSVSLKLICIRNSEWFKIPLFIIPCKGQKYYTRFRILWKWRRLWWQCWWLRLSSTSSTLINRHHREQCRKNLEGTRLAKCEGFYSFSHYFFTSLRQRAKKSYSFSRNISDLIACLAASIWQLRKHCSKLLSYCIVRYSECDGIFSMIIWFKFSNTYRKRWTSSDKIDKYKERMSWYYK